MPKLEVKTVTLKKELSFKNVYMISGLLDGVDTVLEMMEGAKYAPKVGEVLDVTVEITDFGPRATKVRKPGSFSGGGNRTDPEVQKMIARENALTNAVTFQAELAKMTGDIEKFTTENVLLVANKFSKFNISGEMYPGQSNNT